MTSFELPFIKPSLPSGEELATDLTAIVSANWFTNFGPFERRFRAEIEDYLGGLAVATFANATIALMAAVETLVTRPGGQVVVPSFTFAAGPAAIQWSGSRPLFIDIDQKTLQPSIESASRAFEAHGAEVTAILLGNSFGIGNPEIRHWEALAEGFGVPLIIDSAAGFGSRYADGSLVGTAGTCEIFSFHATKPFAIGEGGAVATRDPELAQRLRSFSNFGFDGAHGATALGLNGKLQELNAAIGIRQLARFEGVLARRRAALDRLRKVLEPLGLIFPDGIDHSAVCFATALAADNAQRDTVLSSLRAHGVEARAYYAPPVHLQPYYAGCARADALGATLDIAGRVLSLPIHESMVESDIDRIRDAMIEADHR